MTSDRHKRVCELFFRVVDLTPEEQASILSAECGDELELRKAVEVMLGSDLSRSILSDRSGRQAQFSAESWIGKTLGHYQIGEELGEGGMGIVFSARDVRLGRSVALKILPPERVTNPDQKRRFLQEARSASALNHPNIVQVFDIGQQDGVDFIVMERVSGKLLGDLILEDGVPLNQALHYSAQIAAALETAHQVGIVHRDLKPSNAIVDERGNVKVLDFGLAKLIGDASRSSGPGTLVDDYMTKQGLVLGTVAYMSPEQAEGQQVDARSDIFSLGSMLYEMLSGQHPFRRETPTGTLAAVIAQEPEPLKDVDPQVSQVLQRCLHKNRDRRFQTMADLKVALEELEEGVTARRLISAGKGLAKAPVSKKRSRRWVWGAVAAVPLLASVAFFAARKQPVEEPTPHPPVPVTSRPGFEWMPTISPDGNQVAYAWAPRFGDPGDLYVQMVEGGESLQLTATPEREKDPAWSLDGRWIAFRRVGSGTCNTELVLISPLGGAERKVAEVCGGWGLTWTPDSQYLVTGGYLPREDAHGLLLVSVDSGEQRRITSAAMTEYDWQPAFSPDGRTLLFSRGSFNKTGGILVSDVTPDWNAKSELRRIEVPTTGFLVLAWASDSESIFVGESFYEGGILWLADRAGEHAPRQLPFTGRQIVTLATNSEKNRLIYEHQSMLQNIRRVDRSGNTTPILSSTMKDSAAHYSADGQRIAFRSKRTGALEIWVGDSDGSNLLQLTNYGRGDSASPRFSPDGRRVVFDSDVGGTRSIYTVGSQGGRPRRLTPGNESRSMPSWSRNGQWIYYSHIKENRQDIWRIPAQGGEAEQITRNGGFAAIESRDGRYLYYTKTDRTTGGLYRMALSDGEEELLLEGIHRRAFDVGDRGVYYVKPLDEKETPDFPYLENSSRRAVLERMAMQNRHESGNAEIRYYEPATGKDSFVAEVRKPWNFLSVSPDEQSFLYTVFEAVGSDLMRLELPRPLW